MPLRKLYKLKLWFSVTSSWQIHYYSTLTFSVPFFSWKNKPLSRILFPILSTFQGLLSLLTNYLSNFFFMFSFLQNNSKMLWTWLNFGLKEKLLLFLLYDFNWLLLQFSFSFRLLERDYPKLFYSTVSSSDTRWHNIHFPMIMINNKLLPNGFFVPYKNSNNNKR